MRRKRRGRKRKRRRRKSRRRKRRRKRRIKFKKKIFFEKEGIALRRSEGVGGYEEKRRGNERKKKDA